MEHLNQITTDSSAAENLASDILQLSRNTLLVKLRFLEPALCQLPMISDPGITYAVDGYGFYYDFVHVLRSYKIQKELVMRDYLHAVFHCLFHHPFIGEQVNPYAWNLACDIAVEYALSSLSLPELTCDRIFRQDTIIAELSTHVKSLTAEHLYHYFNNIHLPPEELETLRDIFRADEHDLWYQHSQTSDDTSKSDDQNSESTENEDSTTDNIRSSSDSQTDEPELRPDESDQSDAEELWDHIADIMKVDLNTFSSKYGTKTEHLLLNLEACTEKKIDYTDFLRKFTVLGEEMCLNDEDFDYIYYTYGLKLYRNIPFIEPLEYKELKKIREFVIVIDTSASVQGDIVSSFVRQTWQILKQKESFFRKMILYIIQCDCEIQNITLISNETELDAFLEHFELKGGGGTDFCPVFDYIASLQSQRKLLELRGLLYFTDGDGIYPAHPPAYRTAFLFTEPPVFKNKIPSWIITVLIDMEESNISDSLILKSIDK